ncbi:MAG: DNA-deoxyinosine glycosylase [Polaromonas sp.]|nr:DNA-deoxyinosine glycosylase [Polaromonas sp.]
MLTGLPPLVSGRTRLLILGSFPGVASLTAQQYYGHRQNHFWKILQAIWPSNPIGTGVSGYEIRSEWLLSKELGLWDVYASCEREGSLDSAIRHPVVNDFAAVRRLCPELQAIVHNGGESFKHSRRVSAALAGIEGSEAKSVGVQFHKLPSTSPANASWSFERKLAAWREVFEEHRLI